MKSWKSSSLPFEPAPDEQLLDEEARHHRLPSAGVVGEQEAERLTRNADGDRNGPKLG